MAGRTLEQQVAALRALDVQQPAAIDELRKAIRSKRGFVIAAAAKIVAEHRLELVGELAEAFGALVGDEATKRDPGCRGKLAIAKALVDLDEWDDRVFVAGLAVVQIEGYDPVDMAAPLRGMCGIAHARFMRPDALDVLAMLLADEWRNARLAAAQGLGDAGRIDATALLRYKLIAGDDDEPEVLAQCFDSLFALAPESSTTFAIQMLGRPALAEAAAIALGSHRASEAFEPLVAWCAGCKPEQRRRVGYVAIALLRSDGGNAWLVETIRNASHDDAIAAAKALATFKDYAAVGDSLRTAARAVGTKTRKEIEALLDR
ncbi:MAG TPA: hypothetical protein VFO79_01785 [Xanthomonadales bacterium]|nr:hypothetical protein [Xanthomonadales bacterium]